MLTRFDADKLIEQALRHVKDAATRLEQMTPDRAEKRSALDYQAAIAKALVALAAIELDRD